MPLPQQIIERLARETPKTPGWSAELLAFSVAMFTIGLVVYGGIMLGYRPYIESQIQKLNNQIELFKQQVPETDQQKIASFYSQLINLRTILGSRVAASPTFAWIESHMETNISFTNFTLNLPRNQLTLAGVAKSAEDIGLEARIFEADPNIANVLVGTISSGSPGWQFTMTLTFAQGFFVPGSNSLSVSASSPVASSTAASSTAP